jgi:ankyrin repeat protein
MDGSLAMAPSFGVPVIEHGYAKINEPQTEHHHHEVNALIIAIMYEQYEIVVYLLEQGADLTYQTASTGDTPLAHAAMNERLTFAQLLCHAGASPPTRNHHGRIPLMLAVEYLHFETVNYLVERSATETNSITIQHLPDPIPS